MLDRCRQCHISLNLKKCIFYAPFGIFLGHVVCKQGLLVDLSNIVVILDLQPVIAQFVLSQNPKESGYKIGVTGNNLSMSP
jgi:hypothetical protein